jgi:protein gp37
MSDGSTIQWLNHLPGYKPASWNPTTGCTKVSPGCAHCYAEGIASRFWGERKFTDVQMHPERLEIPLHWKRQRVVFVDSMSDLFHEDVPDEFVDKVFAVMGRSQHCIFILLTKRPARMLEYFRSEELYRRILIQSYKIDGPTRDEAMGSGISDPVRFPWHHLWLGVTVENQRAADERIPLLLQTPAAVRWVSVEPMLEEIDLTTLRDGSWWDKEGANLYDALLGYAYWSSGDTGLHGPSLDWVVAGCESGPHARPFDEDWARNLRDQCVTANVPFFLKQSYSPRIGKIIKMPWLDLRQWMQYPASYVTQEEG